MARMEAAIDRLSPSKPVLLRQTKVVIARKEDLHSEAGVSRKLERAMKSRP